MPFQENSKDKTEAQKRIRRVFGIFWAVLLALLTFGCNLDRTIVRPSFDEGFKEKSTVRESRSRASYKKKSPAKSEANGAHTSEEHAYQEEEKEQEPLAPLPLPPERKPAVRSTAISRAVERYLGRPYRFGGTTERGFDCSGFVWRVFQDIGYTDFVRTNAQIMFDTGRPVSRNALKDGDLIFFYDPQNRRRIGHVGIYIDGRFAHASSSSGVIYSELNDIYWSRFFAGFRRLLP